MNHYVKVLSLAAPLSFLLGLGVSYYQGQLEKDPGFMKPEITLLTSDSLQVKKHLSQLRESSGFSITSFECSNTDDCKSVLNDHLIHLVILDSSILKDLERSKLIRELPHTFADFIQSIHVDFRRPYFDPETRFSMPLFWNVYGFLTPDELKAGVDVKEIGDVPEELRSKFIFTSDALEQKKLRAAGLWERFQFHQDKKPSELISDSFRPIIQWPSGAITDRLFLDLKDYSYQLPEYGASIAIYGAALPSRDAVDLDIGKRFVSYLTSLAFHSDVASLLPVATTLSEDSESIDSKNSWQQPAKLRNFELYKLHFDTL